MAEQWQLRKGSTAENEGFVGAEGELTYDTATKAVHVHDGETAGGALIDAVIAYQLPTSENGYTWYRKYASGWVEMGGWAYNIADGGTVSLPVTMANIGYSIQVTPSARNRDGGTGYTDNNWLAFVWQGKSTTGFTIKLWDSDGSAARGNYPFYWQVSGIAA